MCVQKDRTHLGDTYHCSVVLISKTDKKVHQCFLWYSAATFLPPLVVTKYLLQLHLVVLFLLLMWRRLFTCSKLPHRNCCCSDRLKKVCGRALSRFDEGESAGRQTGSSSPLLTSHSRAESSLSCMHAVSLVVSR